MSSMEQWRLEPRWIAEKSKWPKPCVAGPDDEVLNTVRVSIVSVNAALIEYPWWTRISIWTRLVGLGERILSWKMKDISRTVLEERSECLLYRIVQESLFSVEINMLKQGRQLMSSSKLYRFNPFLDKQGLLWVGGRWQETTWDFETRHPIFLGKHYITESMVQYHHRKCFHAGVEALLSFLRKKFWTIGSRRLARSVKNRCVTCCRFDGHPCAEMTAPLPGSRVNLVRPFYSCGIDYAGPLLARVSNHGERCKVWIALFVCAQTRAVHLEIVETLTTEDFLLAYRRFVGRRGKPYEIISDNAAMLTASRMLSVLWSFIPPASPWFGGFYERLVKAVKLPLKKVLGRSMVWKKELETLLVEIEALVNSRPLTHVPGDDDLGQPLTPAMLMGNFFIGEPHSPEEEQRTSPISLRRAEASSRIKYLRDVKEHLSNRWRTEYVAQLRLFNHKKGQNVSQGDVVLLVDSKKKRSDWSLGLVKKVFLGRDNKIRVVEVKVGNAVFVRSVHCLIPLELSS